MKRWLALLLGLLVTSISIAADCRKTGEVCLDGPGSKIVNGASVYRDCWLFQDTYECVDPDSVDYCAALQSTPGCNQTSATCTDFAFNGACLRFDKTFRCGDYVAPPVGTTRLADSYTVVSDNLDYTQCAALQNNPSCKKAATVCIDGPGIRNIDGLDVYSDCWTYRDDWTCVAGDYQNWCAPLISLGCVQQPGDVCVEYAWDGTCNRYERTFACTNTAPVSGPTIVNLNTSYTIVADNLDASACQANETNANCTLTGEVCVEGPETRTINGLPVYKDCWRYERSYACIAANPVNYCVPLETAGCTLVSQSCSETAWNGACNAYDNTYRCDNEVGPPLPPNVLFLNNEYTLIRDEEVDACADKRTNPNCVMASSTCVEGPETRLINGMPVYKDCWLRTEQWVCAEPGMTESDCSDLETNPKCTLTDTSCTSWNDITNSCGLTTRVYRCETRPEQTVTETVCGTERCIGAICQGVDSEPDRDFANAITSLEIGRQASVYGDYSAGFFFRGARADCSKKLFGVSCCEAKVQGGTDNSSFSLAKEFGTQAGKEAIRFLGSSYVHDALFSTDLVPTLILDSLYGTAGGTSFTAAFNFYGITYTQGIGFGFDPTSFAIAVAITVVMQYLQCDQDEQVLALKKGVGLCHYVGTYCGRKVLGACVEKEESYCCFNSKLARILHEQGRPQLGMGWGSAQDPQCQGYTQVQLEALDFSQMDLSEFINDLTTRSFNSAASQARSEERVQEIRNRGGNSYFPPPGPVSTCRPPNC